MRYHKFLSPNYRLFLFSGLSKNQAFSALIVLLLMVYILFPNSNSTMDAYAYAGYTKYNSFLFTPHHLLHNPLIFFLNFLLKFIGIERDIIALSKMTNGIFAIFNLIIFKKILTQLKVPKKTVLIYLLILGFSFSLWRYGTENETYIIPSTFSLLGSLSFLKFIRTAKNRSLFLSGLYTMISCLFHQLYIFWWLGLLIGFIFKKRTFQTFLVYAAPFTLVPIVYGFVIVLYEEQTFTFENLFKFVLHDFYGRSMLTNFGWKGLFFQVLNSFRTFFQIHPNIYYLIKRSFIFCIPLFFGFFLCYQFFKLLFKKKLIIKKEKASLFIKTHLYIGAIIYLFAYCSFGNIEFMVALPYILILCISKLYNVNQAFLWNLAITLFVWNFSFGIFPNYHYKYYNDDVLTEYMIKNPHHIYIVKNAFVKNNYFYRTGIDNAKNIILYTKIDKKEIESLLKENKCIYTDLIHKPTILNREQIVAKESLSETLKNYPKTVVLSYKGFYGKSFLYRICQ